MCLPSTCSIFLFILTHLRCLGNAQNVFQQIVSVYLYLSICIGVTTIVENHRILPHHSTMNIVIEWQILTFSSTVNSLRLARKLICGMFYVWHGQLLVLLVGAAKTELFFPVKQGGCKVVMCLVFDGVRNAIY